MNYLLIQLKDTWADEFDVDCLWVTTEEEFKAWKHDLSKRNIKESIEIYLGTSEWITFDSFERIINSLIITPISNTFYIDFVNMIGETFGLIKLDDLSQYYDYLKE